MNGTSDESQAVLKQGGRQPAAAGDRVHAGSAAASLSRCGRRRPVGDRRDGLRDATRGHRRSTRRRSRSPASASPSARRRAGRARPSPGARYRLRRRQAPNGVATAPQIVANATAGAYQVSASIAGVGAGGDVQPHEQSGCAASSTPTAVDSPMHTSGPTFRRATSAPPGAVGRTSPRSTATSSSTLPGSPARP